MIYILFFILALLKALVVIFEKKYSKMTLNTVASEEIFLFFMSIGSALFYAAVSGFKIIPNVNTLIYSAVLALFAAVSIICVIIALRKTSVVNVSVFQNSGSIAVAYIFGVFFMRESVSVFNILACVIALFITIKPFFSKKDMQESTLIGYILCLILFFEAGMVSCFYKLYTVDTNVCSESVLCFWANVLLIPYTLSTFIFKLKKSPPKKEKISIKATGMVGLITVTNCVFTLLEIYIIKNISLTFYTIGNSSFSLIFSAVLSAIIFGESLTKESLTTIFLSICSVILGAL